MSSEEEGQVRIGSFTKRRKLQRACDVCRRKKIRCDGVQMPGQQCTNCTDYGLECTYVESAKKRGPPKLYIERLENRVKKLEEFIGRISPEALEQLDVSPSAPLQVSPHNPSIPEWTPYDPSPRRFIRHVGSGKSPPPASDEESSVKFLMDDFDQMHITLDDSRYLGKSSGIMLINLALEMKRVYMGDGGGSTRQQNVRRLYTEPLPVTPMQAPNFKFPDPDLMAALIDLYFIHMNRYLPLLHRPTFERAINSGLHYTDASFAATLLLVCAVAAKYSDDPRVMDEPQKPGGKPDPHSSGWKWFAQVPLVKTVSISVPSLYDLQFYALVGEFLQASSVPQACWTVVGIGIRIAQDVGTHRRKLKEAHTVEDELWNRAFWVLLCLDRLFSSSLGRPCSLQDEDFDIDMPMECDDEYWEHSDPNLRWRQPTPEKTPSIMAYFTWYIKLNRILAFLLRTVYATNKSRILYGFVGQHWEETIVSEVDSALESWMAKLPDHLRWDPQRPDEVFFNQSASLFCFYQHVQILVHRPFIPTPNKPDNALSFPSLAICTNAARACSHALDIQRNRFGLAPQPLMTAAFSAGVILLLSIWGGRRSGLTTDFDKEMMDVKKCMDVLALAEVRWYLAGRLSDILNELASVGDMPLPQRRSNSPFITPKRERKQNDDDDEYVLKSAARLARRIKKGPESVSPRGTVGVQRQPSPQLHTPQYDVDYRKPPQQQPLPLNPQQYWPCQSTSQLTQEPSDTYVQFRSDACLQAQVPVSVPAFGQSSGPAIYLSGPEAIPARAVGTDSTVGTVYPYQSGGTVANTLSNMNIVDMGLGQRTGDVRLDLNPSGALASNVDQSFMWSNAPTSFESDEWGNYISALNNQRVPPDSSQGTFNPTG